MIDTVASFGLDGRAAEEALDSIGITTNKQIIPDDPRPPLRPSGIRLGTPACTTRGMDEDDMRQLAKWMVQAFGHRAMRTQWVQHTARLSRCAARALRRGSPRRPVR